MVSTVSVSPGRARRCGGRTSSSPRTCRPAGRLELRGERVGVGKQRPRVLPQRDAGRAGEGRDADDAL